MEAMFLIAFALLVLLLYTIVQAIPAICMVVQWIIFLGFWFGALGFETVLHPKHQDHPVRNAIRGIVLGTGIVLLSLFAKQVFAEQWQVYLVLLLGFVFVYLLLLFTGKMRVLYLLIPLCFVWLIGCDLSYNVKRFDANIASVEYVGRRSSVYSVSRLPEENECSLHGHYVFDAVYESEYVNKSHILDSYSEGDRYVVAENAAEESNDWLAVMVGDQKGYIQNSGLKNLYNRTSEEINARQQEQIQSRWYRVVPMPVLKVCEFVYEHSGPLCRISFE